MLASDQKWQEGSGVALTVILAAIGIGLALAIWRLTHRRNRGEG